MKFFADTANLEEISYCFSKNVDDGITTNPMIMKITGDLSLGFKGACKIILDKYPNVPVSLETDLRGIDVKSLNSEDPNKVRDILLEQAYDLSNLGSNVVVKIPICEGGLMAAKELAKKGIKTNITACMMPYQALEAAKMGKGYVSLFSNRMLDSNILELKGHSLDEILTNPNWKEHLKNVDESIRIRAWDRTLAQISYVAEKLDANPDVELIVGSIRSPDDIYKLISAEPQIITIPTKIVKELGSVAALKEKKRIFGSNNVILGDSLFHPMTQYTLEEFERAADSYRK